MKKTPVFQNFIAQLYSQQCPTLCPPPSHRHGKNKRLPKSVGVCVCVCGTYFTRIQLPNPTRPLSALPPVLPSPSQGFFFYLLVLLFIYLHVPLSLSVSPLCRRRGLNPPHRVKSISMTTFSQQEVEFLQNHGNEVIKDAPPESRVMVVKNLSLTMKCTSERLMQPLIVGRRYFGKECH